MAKEVRKTSHFTAAQEVQIYKIYKMGSIRLSELAKKLNVSSSCVHAVVRKFKDKEIALKNSKNERIPQKTEKIGQKNGKK